MILWLSFLLPLCHMGAQESAALLRSELRAMGNAEYAYNRVSLLPSAQEKYTHMFNAIAQAKHYVHLEYFKVMNDSSGQEMMRLLVKKAQEGVEVRLLIDDYANRCSRWSWTRAERDSLSLLGVRFETFDPFRFPWLNHAYHRDHRKIVIIDGLKAYMGGMNVGDYYLTGTSRTGRWRDMHMCLEGPVVSAFERIFERIWERESREMLDSLRYVAPVGQIVGKSVVSVINREPGRLSNRMRCAFVAAINGAQKEIRIVNPYLTNVRSVRRALKRALRRGVCVRIMVSAKCDVSLTPNVMAVEMKRLMRWGAKVYYYKEGFHHSKIMTIDGTHATVGTANLDGRSMLFDYEINAFIFDCAVVRQLNNIFDADLKHCQLLTPENFRQQFPLGKRIVGYLLTPIRSIF